MLEFVIVCFIRSRVGRRVFLTRIVFEFNCLEFNVVYVKEMSVDCLLFGVKVVFVFKWYVLVCIKFLRSKMFWLFCEIIVLC